MEDERWMDVGQVSRRGDKKNIFAPSAPPLQRYAPAPQPLRRTASLFDTLSSTSSDVHFIDTIATIATIACKIARGWEETTAYLPSAARLPVLRTHGAQKVDHIHPSDGPSPPITTPSVDASPVVDDELFLHHAISSLCVKNFALMPHSATTTTSSLLFSMFTLGHSTSGLFSAHLHHPSPSTTIRE
ncbi:uncharacterized protein AB675_1421 [Cyphellophora attinorum]|uniref:Uncharacterized protein n=1 Tax=Cyphellophora attinorum TaxID=1664694 RepID=A0A0N1HPS4_9EURO|nr:uncharacterized protein AB675_1421 [Phialophora attinorum]KPI37303.1 hypothetical protein AB675_1421 [Phialophora attinorum]